MDAPASKFVFFAILSIFFVCSPGTICKEIKKVDKQPKHSSYRRELIRTIQHDFINPPMTAFPTTPLTNPVTTPSPATVIAPPDTSTPPIVTVPSANPVIATPLPPITNPINPPMPITNPVTTPSTTIPGGQPNPVTTPEVVPTTPSTTIPGGQPNPVTTPVVVPTTPSTTIPGGQPNPVTTPVVPTPMTTNAPAVPGQSWCVARGGLPETTLQAALDYACGMGGADCSAIQQGGSCYNPDTMLNHASYAFNSYYQRNTVQTSCDFGGAAMITNVNPSSGSCVFTTPASPTMASPLTTPLSTPTTDSSSGATPASLAPPNNLSPSNPALGGGITGYGETPPTASISSASIWSLQPLIACITVVISIITGRIVLDI